MADADSIADVDDAAWRERAIERSTRAARQRAAKRVQQFLDSTRHIIEEKNSTDFTVHEVVERRSHGCSRSSPGRSRTGHRTGTAVAHRLQATVHASRPLWSRGGAIVAHQRGRTTRMKGHPSRTSPRVEFLDRPGALDAQLPRRAPVAGLPRGPRRRAAGPLAWIGM